MGKFSEISRSRVVEEIAGSIVFTPFWTLVPFSSLVIAISSVTQKVVTGVYQGVTTVELHVRPLFNPSIDSLLTDSQTLTAETEAYLITKYPDYLRCSLSWHCDFKSLQGNQEEFLTNYQGSLWLWWGVLSPWLIIIPLLFTKPQEPQSGGDNFERDTRNRSR